MSTGPWPGQSFISAETESVQKLNRILEKKVAKTLAVIYIVMTAGLI